MKIIKRDGTEVEFDAAKIVTAVTKANNRVEAAHKLSEAEIVSIGEYVRKLAEELTRALTVEEIQDILGVSKTSAYNLVKSNVFHSVKIGDHYRISRKSFDKWLDGGNEDE